MADAHDVCWVCERAGARLWKEGRAAAPLGPDDLRITDARYGTTLTLLRCNGCGFIFADRRETERLVEAYQELHDEGYVQTLQARRRQMVYLLDRLHRVASPKSLLDVGAATGLLVEVAQERGIRARGVEVSASLVAEAQARGIDVVAGTLESADLGQDTFDCVTVIDVLEHVTDPLELIRQAAARLKPGGTILVVTPDIGSTMARLLGKRWWHLRLAHVGYFDDATLRLAATRTGLQVRSSFPVRWFFPVGYLVERVQRYAPAPMNGRRVRELIPRRVAAWTVPVLLGDSLAVVLERSAAP